MFKDRYGAIPSTIFYMLALWTPAITLLFCVVHAGLLSFGDMLLMRHIPDLR